MQKESYKIKKIVRFAAISVGVLALAVCAAAALFSADLKASARETAQSKLTLRSETVLTERQMLAQSSTKPVCFNFIADGKVYPVVTSSDTISGALQENGIVLSEEDSIQGGTLEDAPADGVNITLVHITRTTVTETETVAFKTRYVLDKKLMAGESVVRTPGKTGSIIRTYEVSLRNGVEVSRTLTDTRKIAPVDEVIAYYAVSSFANSRGQQVTYSSAVSAKATAYVPDAKWGYQTAVGQRARVGVIAVDPSVIPLGTKVYVKSEDPNFGDYGFAVAWDTGGAIKGNIIDMFMERSSLPLAYSWGRRPVTIYILDDQSIDVFALRHGDEVFIS